MGIKKKFIRALVDFQLKLFEQLPVRNQLKDFANIACKELPALENVNPPYELGMQRGNAASQRSDIVIVTSRFRSGSTFLWNIFRQTGGFTSYYEPFNERRWFDERFRGNEVDSTHRGVGDYWAEYSGMESLSRFYSEDWTRYRLLMGESDYDPNMQAYIESLVESAPGRPVLQFNRIDFRLAWIKSHFPNAKLIHLYRHPRDQWCSFLTDKRLMNKNDVAETYIDGFYLNRWCDDLATHFPFLDRRITAHPYQRFYYLWKLSFLFGKHYSDLSFSFEELIRSPDTCMERLFAVLGVENPPIPKLCSLVDAPEEGKWRKYAEPEWYEAFERECEYQLDIFFQGNNGLVK